MYYFTRNKLQQHFKQEILHVALINEIPFCVRVIIAEMFLEILQNDSHSRVFLSHEILTQDTISCMDDYVYVKNCICFPVMSKNAIKVL